MFAQVLYAMFLAPDQAEKQRLLEEVIDYTEQAARWSRPISSPSSAASTPRRAWPRSYRYR